MDEVERLLQHPEDLKRLPNMLEEYSAKHAANKQAPARALRCTCASRALSPTTQAISRHALHTPCLTAGEDTAEAFACTCTAPNLAHPSAAVCQHDKRNSILQLAGSYTQDF